MSKINAIRFVNLTYNNGNTQAVDETFFLNSQSTLFNLENGFGKSVLIQMLIAPFVHKRYRNLGPRQFTEYFTDTAPTHVMIEWALDQNAGYLLTGLMVRKNPKIDENNDDELELLAYVSEYRKPCPQDLVHMPVVEKKEKGLQIHSFNECRERMDSFKKANRGSFNTYDLNNSAQNRQYFEKLATFGIINKEWQIIIKRINESESGLSQLFEQCKTEMDLIIQWFLPAIEEKLNYQSNQIAAFQSTVEKHVRQYWENMDKLRSRDSILKFGEEAARLQETAGQYASAAADTQVRLNRIAAYYRDLNSLFSETRAKHDASQAAMQNLRDSLSQMEYEERSAGYYAQSDLLSALDAQIEQLSLRQTAAENDLSSHLATLHILECARQQLRVNEDALALARITQAIEICRREEADLIPERDYLGYLLRLDAEKHLKTTQASLEDNQAAAKQNTAQQQELERQRDTLTQKGAHLHQVLGQLEKGLETYETAENQFSRKWSTRLTRNLVDQYSPSLEAHEKTILDTISEEQTTLERLQRELNEANRNRDIEQRNLRDQEAEKAKLAEDLSESRRKLAAYEEELASRRLILQHLDLRENDLFDLPLITRTCENKILELDVLIRNLTTGLARLDDQIERLATGQNTPLTDEQTAMFNSLGIPIVYGMKWLKNNGASEEDNRALVKRLPFLPYALLLTAAEWQRLQHCDNGAYTTQPIPVVLREEIASDASVLPDGPHFYMLFNHELLNEDRVRIMLEEMQAEKVKKSQDLEHFKAVQQEYIIRLNTVKGHTVTQAVLDAAVRAAQTLNEGILEITGTIDRTKESIISLETRRDTLMAAIPECSSHIQSFNMKLTDLRILMEQYAAYLTQKEELNATEEQLAHIQSENEAIGKQLQRLSALLNALQNRHAELTVRLQTDQTYVLTYQGYKEVPAPQTLDPSVTAEMASITARFKAITEGVSRRWQELEEDAREARTRHQRSQDDLDRIAAKYDLPEGAWTSVQYSPAAEDQADAEVRFCRNTLSDIEKEIDSRKLDAVRIEERMANILSGIKKDCHQDQPVSRSEIPQIDFAARKTALAEEITRTEQEVQKLHDYEQMIDSNITSLSKYEGVEVREPVEWTIPLNTLGKQEMRTLTGQLVLAYDRALSLEHETQEHLVRLLTETQQDEAFQSPEYKGYFSTLQSMTDNPNLFERQLTVISQSLQLTLKEVQIAIEAVEEERDRINSMLLQYVEKVHAYMRQIDKQSTIDVRDKNVRMLRLQMPNWDDNQMIYQANVSQFMENITSAGIDLLDRGESFHDYIGKQLTCCILYDSVVGLHNLHIEITKIEQNRNLPISWEMARKVSGGEGFLSFFIVLACLLDFMRYDEGNPFADKNEGKVLIMDNPFAQTTAPHLLKPITDLAKKINIQLICFTAIHGESILDQFENIYLLDLVSSGFGSIKYLKGTRVTKESLNSTHIDIHPSGEQLEMPF